MVCFSIRIVFIAVRFVRIPVWDGLHIFVCHMNCTADLACPAYGSSQYIILGAGRYVSDYNSADPHDALTLFVRFGCRAYITAHA